MPSSYAKQLAYRANARVVGRRWRDYLQVLFIVLAVAATGVLTPSWPGKWFTVGAGVGALLMTMALATLRLHDPQVLGYAAEESSVESLRKVRGWTVIDNLPFERVDVDHVVITPATVLAVESKHHGFLPPTHPSSHQRARRDREAALAAARKLRLLLRAKELHEAVTVTPVLMIWGPGAPDFAEGYRIVDGVHVVDAKHPELWRHLFSAPVVGSDVRSRIDAALREFSRTREVYEDAKARPLRRIMIDELRDGVREERAARSARRAFRDSLRRRHGRVGEVT